MKLSISLLIAITFCSLSVIRAQEMETGSSPAPSDSDQSSSATIETTPSTPSEALPVETPAMTPVETMPVATPPAKKEMQASSPAAATTNKKAAAADASTSKSSAAAKPSTGPDTGTADSNVKRLENEWEVGVMKHDTAFLESRVANDYMGYSSKGKRIGKADLLKERQADTDKYTSANNGNIAVRTYGSNVAVAMGTSKETGTGKDGKQFARGYVWTDTWMLRGGHWQCIASHTALTARK